MFISIIPGNHDRRKHNVFGGYLPDLYRDNDNLDNYHDYMTPPGQNISYLIYPDNYTFIYGGWLFVGLDSGYDVPLFKGGGLGTDQIQALKDIPDMGIPKIVFMHHPAINDNDGYCIDKNRDSFIKFCEDENNNVELILTGHTHNDRVFDGTGKPKDLASNIRPLYIQTASYPRKKVGYRVIKVGNQGAHLYPSGTIYVQNWSGIWLDSSGDVVFYVCDSEGRRTGISEDGEIFQEIPQTYYLNFSTFSVGSSALQPNNIQGIISYNPEELTVTLREGKIVPFKEKYFGVNEVNRMFNISIKNQELDVLTTISYHNLSITENSTATIHLNRTVTNYSIEVDSNGDNFTDVMIEPELVETNYAPSATISSPLNDSTYVHGDEITFIGTGTDPEDGVLNASSLVWTSDMNGIIDFGNEFNTTNLSPGAHTITLMANDSADLVDTDSVKIVINAPDLTLNSSNIVFLNSNPTEGDVITINATVHNIGLVNATNVSVRFFDGITEFEIGNITLDTAQAGENATVSVTWDTTGKGGKHSIGVRIDSEDSIEEMNETNNRASKSILINEGQPQISFFDTEASDNPYPSISGTHNGTITPSENITVSKLFTYSCQGTGGHTEYAAISYSNGTTIAEANWNGYTGDWHNISFNQTFTMYVNETYNYTIRTGSYPQIIHEREYNATGGTITCSKFTDVNGRTYTDWIPAIRLY